MSALRNGLPRVLGRMTQSVMTGSVSAAVILVLGAFGLFWLGMALHWALAPALGMFWAWLLPALLYLAAAAGVALIVFRTRSDEGPSHTARAQTGEAPPRPMNAEQLGMELGMELSRELEREIREHPLRAVSAALLGGAVLGASPELRRTIFGRAEGRGERKESRF